MLRLEEKLVALCDTDRRRAEPWQKEAPEVPWYEDFRRMLDEQNAQLDGVVAALSPMHNHGAIAAAAMRRGKHVFIEKPIGHNVGELPPVRLHWYLAPRPELEERGVWQRLQEIAGRPPISNLNHSGPMMEMLYLSHVAGLFPKQTLEYHPKQGKIVNLDEANRWLSWPRRDGWEL